MIVKVCGMKHSQNIVDLSQLPINFMGLIFYSKSPRYVEKMVEEEKKEMYNAMRPNNKRRVGVFVNDNMETILQKTAEYGLDLIQLHGNESPDFCEKLNEEMPIIKAFSIACVSDIEQTEAYKNLFGYFLFDTKTSQYGGSGKKFDWSIVDEYKGNTPFLLSGGISIDDVEAIRRIKHPKFAGIDINSQFEIEPGLKDIKKLEKFINEIRS